MVKHAKIILCLLVLAVLMVPAVSAWSPGQPWTDNSEHIAAMQAYTAYAGELFKAKMDGAIQYIGTLNQSTSTLQNDEQQFLATVSSVQSMSSNDTITQAWGTMTQQVTQFRTDLKTAISAGNGSGSALQAAVNSSVTADQANIQNLDTTYWTDREKSRLDEFSYNDGRRTDLLTNLTAKGIDVSSAQAIESQIQALQPQLKAALDAKDEAQIRQVNSQIDSLCQQLSQAVVNLSWQARESARLAQFTNTTTRMQDRLTNLTARGLDVSDAQTILSQITALQSQLQTALQNHDQSTLSSVNSQLESLDQQYAQALQQITAQARSQLANQTAQNRENRTAGERRTNQSVGGFAPKFG
ncbi:hypothetical protein Mboo_0289 [Methanoregula boonei 6A8]|uniref:Uncharacterized protein n=1 Tax=Methanoregula boonei (strain DSM 21154 / JCM 14090 / 6A8) TaxID=456442 RepID=A7I500_METB6|nr:hypothetical protein [Methanoregula boonei]ABS54811.1 hypothetical protein Mboo_0289 [Methanoregula boonei 6A8]